MNGRILFVLGTITYAFLLGPSLAAFLFGLISMVVILATFPQLGGLKSVLPLGARHLVRGIRLIFNGILFVLDFVYDLTVSNIVLAHDIWTPKDRYTPRFVDVPVADLSSFQVAFLASRITLTPGTLSVAVSPEKDYLIVHTMYPGGDGYEKSLRRPIDILLKGMR